jgi:hypothetical protein
MSQTTLCQSILFDLKVIKLHGSGGFAAMYTVTGPDLRFSYNHAERAMAKFSELVLDAEEIMVDIES